MSASDTSPELLTHFAPAARASAEQVAADHERLLSSQLMRALLEAVPDLLMVLNTQRQILAVNTRLVESLGVGDPASALGLRPGELVHCLHATECPGGCGTSEACSVCGAVNTILQALECRGTSTGECRISTSGEADGGALDLEVQATFMAVEGVELVVLALHDISAQKRRTVLERTFFHDVLNVAAGLQAVAELMSYGEEDPEVTEEYVRDLKRMALQISDEIMAHRQLLAAERGELKLNVQTLQVPEVLDSVVELYRHHTVARDRELQILAAPECALQTDPVLLRRVLGNLVKNALEATAAGGTVTLSARAAAGEVSFQIANPTVMPEAVRLQVFQRSFSTKGGAGRGIGTHSVKLLTERYLGGHVRFTSQEPEGTVFTVTLPAAPSS